MEDTQITYDLIIKYLVNNTFINNINIQSDILKSNFKYKDIFPYKKTGVSQKNNMSLLSSILYLIENEYKLVSEEEQYKLNEIFLNQLKSKWNSSKKSNPLTFNIEDELNTIKIISIVLMLNIIILDFKNDKYYCYNKVNPFMGFLIIAKYENNYEPVSDGDKKIFNYDDLNLKVKDTISENSFNKDEVLKMEGYKLGDNNSFKINLDEYNKTKLNKMKKEQLLNIINMLKLNVSEKETKNNIIQLILNQK
jgi:hypothetical protein